MLRKLSILILLTLLLITSGCLSIFPKEELRRSKHISNFTLDGNHLYFGGGYHLYRLDLSSRSLETIFSPKRILVEQPVVADGVAYFGGISYVNENMNYGEEQGLFAVDLGTRRVQWKFPLGVGGYGTYGTFPVLAGDNILVCAREHLHSLERKTGKERWKLDNWFGATTDSTDVPYVYRDYVYFKINEENFTGSDALDGHWAKVALDSGIRVATLSIAETPGKYHDMSGSGFGELSGGVVYGALRYDEANYPSSRVGALELESQKKLWEVRGSSLRTKPGINDKFVYTVIDKSITALDRKTGRVVWSEPLGEIGATDYDYFTEKWKWEHENRRSRRFAATNETVVVQGSRGIVARRGDNGKLLWFVKMELDEGTTAPVIVQQMVVAVSLQDCSIFALDLKDGRELWRVKLPDCTYFYMLDD